MATKQKAQIIEDGKTLDELIAGNTLWTTLAKEARESGEPDEEIWVDIKDW